MHNVLLRSCTIEPLYDVRPRSGSGDKSNSGQESSCYLRWGKERREAVRTRTELAERTKNGHRWTWELGKGKRSAERNRRDLWRFIKRSAVLMDTMARVSKLNGMYAQLESKLSV